MIRRIIVFANLLRARWVAIASRTGKHYVSTVASRHNYSILGCRVF